jgi:SagB-type dehydrogenase family enzyme
MATIRFRQPGSLRGLLLLGQIGIACGVAETPKPSSDEPRGASIPSAFDVSGVTGAPKSPLDGGSMSLKQALSKRRSVRSFSSRALLDSEILELLWAAQGVTSDQGLRTAPSAGATYPLEVHVLTPKGVYQYVPNGHSVKKLSSENRMAGLSAAALDQGCVKNAAANFVFAGVVERTAARYGDRAGRYVDIEAGCAAENLMLMAVALNLGSVMVGAYDDDGVRNIAELPKGSVPLAIVSVGAISP